MGAILAGVLQAVWGSIDADHAPRHLTIVHDALGFVVLPLFSAGVLGALHPVPRASGMARGAGFTLSFCGLWLGLIDYYFEGLYSMMWGHVVGARGWSPMLLGFGSDPLSRTARSLVKRRCERRR